MQSHRGKERGQRKRPQGSGFPASPRQTSGRRCLRNGDPSKASPLTSVAPSPRKLRNLRIILESECALNHLSGLGKAFWVGGWDICIEDPLFPWPTNQGGALKAEMRERAAVLTPSPHPRCPSESRALYLLTPGGAEAKKKKMAKPAEGFLLGSSLPKNPSDEDLLKDLLIRELLAWMADQMEICRLRWGRRSAALGIIHRAHKLGLWGHTWVQIVTPANP